MTAWTSQPGFPIVSVNTDKGKNDPGPAALLPGQASEVYFHALAYTNFRR